MRRPVLQILICCLAMTAFSAGAAPGRIIKVLPHLLDLKGRHTVSPSLFERDSYQAYLRLHPKEVSTLRFDVQWKSRGSAAGNLRLRIQLRGIPHGGAPVEVTLEEQVKPTRWFARWTSLLLPEDDYRKKIGELTAWRATLWDGDQLLSEQKSFLW